MGSPHVLHELELLPLNPSSYNAQRVCISRNSHPMHGTINAQTVVHVSEGAQSVRTEACIDVNQLPSGSESEDEFASEETPFILRLSHITEASSNGKKRASSDPKSGPTNSEPTKVSYFDHTRTVGDVSLRASEDEEGVLIARKKLRLSKEDLAILEERFKDHSTLNPDQKIALSKQLNLRPRQVEVWFQNRRARNKLKQIEVDCDVLKRCCEGLSEENKRLQKEIVELRALMMGGPCVNPHDFYMPFLGTLTKCPSCKCLSPQPVVAQTTSTTTSISSFNQP